MVNQEQMETVHLYIVPEDQLPPKPDYAGIVIATLCSFILVGMIGLILFSPKSEPTVSFQTTIAGFRLPAVSKTISVPVRATGKGHVNATYATGSLIFYNGQTYTQIIPVGTTVKGADGIAVITDAQAVIPPAAQTIPPTYGQVHVPAHALNAGAIGNIQAGDINLPCCVTSVIAQNPYSFTGGVNERNFTSLTKHDVIGVVASLAPTLRERTIAAFTSSIILEPTCSTASTPRPAIGQETKLAILKVTETCSAVSYTFSTAMKQVIEVGTQYGSVSDIKWSIVNIIQRRGEISLQLYVTAVVKPVIHTRFGNTGK